MRADKSQAVRSFENKIPQPGRDRDRDQERNYVLLEVGFYNLLSLQHLDGSGHAVLGFGQSVAGRKRAQERLVHGGGHG